MPRGQISAQYSANSNPPLTPLVLIWATLCRPTHMPTGQPALCLFQWQAKWAWVLLTRSSFTTATRSVNPLPPTWVSLPITWTRPPDYQGRVCTRSRLANIPTLFLVQI
uniref:Uncharacterized protein n=1 Tax=Cacopsylla melanoneura TaxID=428564 RepID=A0A8D9DY66_9HEMI